MCIFAFVVFFVCAMVRQHAIAHVHFVVSSCSNYLNKLVVFNRFHGIIEHMFYVLFYHYATYTGIPVCRYLWYSGIPAELPEPEWLPLPHPIKFQTSSTIPRLFIFIVVYFGNRSFPYKRRIIHNRKTIKTVFGNKAIFYIQ